MKTKPDKTIIKTKRIFYKLWKNIRDSSPEIWQGNDRSSSPTFYSKNKDSHIHCFKIKILLESLIY